MGYQIQYGTSMVKTYIPERSKLSPYKCLMGLLIIGLLLIAILGGSRVEIQNFLLPGNGELTRNAISQMVTDLSNGKPLGASVEAFCLEIVNDGNVSQ